MSRLRELIADASSRKIALGHFNFSTAEMLRGIVQAAKEAGVPVIVGVSEGERDFFGVAEARAIVTAIGKEMGVPIYLNADHTKSYERAKEAIDVGFDAVVMDGSAMTFEDNVSTVRRVIEYRKERGNDVIIEGELGFIGTSSEVLDKLPPGVPVEESKMTGPDEAKKFIAQCGADLLAPAVGNVHGIVGEEGNPRLSIRRISEIRQACGVPLVLHGASGVAEADVRDAVKAGSAIVHFSTDIRVAYRKALGLSLAEFPDEAAPYKYMREAVKAVKETVKGRLSWLS